METKTIEIDLDVNKAIENLRRTFTESPNDILRRTLLQGGASNESSASRSEQGGFRVRNGIYLPAGTQLRHIAKRSGERYDAEVVDGGIRYGNEVHHSPSKAAIAAVGGNRNGWIFWEYFDTATQRWELLDSLRGATGN